MESEIESLLKQARFDGYIDGYKVGYLKALYLYAVWRNGTQYVGCGCQTVKEAKEEFLKGIECSEKSEKQSV